MKLTLVRWISLAGVFGLLGLSLAWHAWLAGSPYFPTALVILVTTIPQMRDLGIFGAFWVAAIVFTSGTSGRPRPVVLTYGNHQASASGGDVLPFLEYAVPQAVIRFRQGFGRLIRQQTDRGIVLILDSRVIRRGYGRLFLDSLPDVPVATMPGAELLQKIGEFFDKETGPEQES